MHLRNDHAFRAVNDKSAVFRHQRHVAHIDILFFDVADGTGSRVFIDVPHNQAQRHTQRRGIGHAALDAFINVVFGLVQLVLHEFQFATAGKIFDRENRLQNFLQAGIGSFGCRNAYLKKLTVGALLYFNQIGHRCYCRNSSKILAYTLPSCKGFDHYRSPFS